MERFHFYEAELYRVLNLLVDLILQGHSYEPLRPQKRGVCKNPTPNAAFMLAWLWLVLLVVVCCFGLPRSVWLGLLGGLLCFAQLPKPLI